MRANGAVVLSLVGLGAVILSVAIPSAQVPETVRQFGRPVAPMFEGWYRNPDGTATVLVGFFNPNRQQTVDSASRRAEPVFAGAGRSRPANPFSPRTELGSPDD